MPCRQALESRLEGLCTVWDAQIGRRRVSILPNLQVVGATTVAAFMDRPGSQQRLSLMEFKGRNSDRYKVGGEVAATTRVTTVTKIELSWMDNSAKGKTKKKGPHPSVGSSSSEKAMRSSSLSPRTSSRKVFSLACWDTYEEEYHWTWHPGTFPSP